MNDLDDSKILIILGRCKKNRENLYYVVEKLCLFSTTLKLTVDNPPELNSIKKASTIAN